MKLTDNIIFKYVFILFSLSLFPDIPAAVKEIRQVRARYMSKKMLKKGGEREISVSIKPKERERDITA